MARGSDTGEEGMLAERRRRSRDEPATMTASASAKVHQERGALRPRKPVPHVRQAFNWDCGIACVLMIVRSLGLKHVDLRYLRDVCGTTSIWTIDLAHLLRHFDLRVKFYTVTLGANPAYADEKFYKEHMHEDEVRVHRLFSLAGEVGVEVNHRSLRLDELAEVCASPQHLVLILVDKRVLQQGSLPGSEGKGATATSLLCCGMLGNLGNSDYVGHYVVLSDYDSATREFWVKDPASRETTTFVKDTTLEKARKSFGTDEDLIVVPFAEGFWS